MDRLDSFEKYLKYERRYSQHTVIAYMKDLQQFQVYIKAQLGLFREEDLRHGHVRSWIVFLMMDGFTPKSVNRKISTLKSYFKYLKKLGIVPTNPTAKVNAPKIAKRLPTVVREQRLEALLIDADDDSDLIKLRDSLVVDLLYSTGMRRSELINLKKSDINAPLKLLKVLGKGNKERIIPISEALLGRINLFISLRISKGLNHEPALIITKKGQQAYPKLIYNIVHDQLSLVSTVEKRSPHILRHSFATHLANEGAELNSIKEILGHANLSATEIYMHNSIDRLRSVYDKAHPKSGKMN